LGATVVAGAALLAIPIFAAHDLCALGNMGCEVRPEVLVIRWGLYRREIPLKEIESVEKVKLKGEYRPVLRKEVVCLRGRPSSRGLRPRTLPGPYPTGVG